MNYYKRHLGDYARDAAHLSLTEHGAFTVLLDRYYSTEKPITTEDALRVCRARSGPDREVVVSILKEFFREGEEGWTNKRADEEIEAYNVKAGRNREIGKQGGRPKTQTVNSGNPDGSVLETQTVSIREPRPNPSHKPLATSHKEQSPIPPTGAVNDFFDPPRKPKASRKSEGMIFAAFVQACRDAGEKPMPVDHSVFKFAADTGIPIEYLHLAWREFARQYRDTKQTQAGVVGWRKKFENCVRRNWFKLWWFPAEGQCDLTTAGVQLRREKEAA